MYCVSIHVREVFFVTIVVQIKQTWKKVVFQFGDEVLRNNDSELRTNQQNMKNDTYMCCGVTWGLFSKRKGILMVFPAIGYMVVHFNITTRRMIIVREQIVMWMRY